MLTENHQKNKRIQKRLVKGIKIFLKKKNSKIINMLVKDLEIIQKKIKKSVNIVMNAIKISRRRKTKIN